MQQIDIHRRRLKKSLSVSYNYTQGLIAAWQFNDPNDRLKNTSPTPLVTLKANDGIYNVSGIIGSSLDFLGVSNRYYYIDNSALVSFTDGQGNDVAWSRSYWIFIEDFDGADNHGTWFWNKRGGNNDKEYQTLLYNGWLKLILNNPSSGQIGRSYPDTALQPNSWYHILETYDGSKTSQGIGFYINGVDSSSVFESGTYTGQVAGTSNVYLGARAWGTNFGKYDGRMDEIFWWRNRVITPNEALEIYNLQLQGVNILN